ncbi:MAG: Rap1a/Tai family immunity protein [Pseudolabrys sp.]
MQDEKPMKPSSLVLAAACIAMLVTTGHAQPKPYSANEVMKGCRAFIAKTKWEREASDAFSDAFIRGICVGTVSTLAGTAVSLERAAEGTTGVCMRAGEVTVNQQVRVVAAYIDARPNRLHEDFRVLALEAFRDAWPCGGNR